MIKISHIIPIAVILAVIIGLLLCLNTVPEGNVGIRTNFGAATGETVNAGLTLTFPWQRIVNMNTRQQSFTLTTEVFTKDMQETDVILTVFYRLDPSAALKMFKEVGPSYQDMLIAPKLHDALKNTFGAYNAEELIAIRESVGNNVCDAFNVMIASYGLHADDVSMQNIDFSDAFEAAVEAKTVATQEKLRAQTEQEQLTMVAEAEAERAVIAAQAEADKKTIAASADAEVIRVTGEAEAAAIAARAAAITDESIRMTAVENWDGKLPIFGNSDNSIIPLTDVTNLINNTNTDITN